MLDDGPLPLHLLICRCKEIFLYSVVAAHVVSPAALAADWLMSRHFNKTLLALFLPVFLLIEADCSWLICRPVAFHLHSENKEVEGSGGGWMKRAGFTGQADP